MRSPFALMTAVAVTAGGLTLMPPASPATVEARSLAVQPSNIQRTEVCFTVKNIGDPEPQQVSGTLFHKQDYRGGGTALLLQHGSVSERSVWDGGRPGMTGVPSIAEQLAGAGYDVFAIDRLGYGPEQGYGRSPYEGSGWTLTMDSYAEMTHEMVTQIRSGTYRITTGTCPGGATAGRPASKVVLMAQSGGALIIELYATRYHDIDGIVPMVMSNAGCSNRCLQELVDTIAPQLALGRDYVYTLWGPGNGIEPGGPGYSQSCEDLLFYADGVSEDVVAHVCGPGYFGGAEPRLMPSGDISTQAAAMQEIFAGIGNVGPTPALLVFADRDRIFTNARVGDDSPESDTITPEMEYWTTNPGCNCDVEFLWQRNAGHQLFFHDSVTEMTADVIEWLRSRGL